MREAPGRRRTGLHPLRGASWEGYAWCIPTPTLVEFVGVWIADVQRLVMTNVELCRVRMTFAG